MFQHYLDYTLVLTTIEGRGEEEETQKTTKKQKEKKVKGTK